MENSRLHSRNNDGLPVQYDEDENDDLDSSVETKTSQEFSNLGEGSHFVEYKKAHYKNSHGCERDMVAT